MDEIDFQILNLLKNNSRLTNKEIGSQIHMTGQAVGNRINRLLDDKIIKQFTIEIAYDNTQYIRLFMNNSEFTALEEAVNRFSEIEVFDKVSGQACYIIVAHFSREQLQVFIETISRWARYSVETVLVNRKK
ncbi:AsnC family transcriptional regulator [Enterococcus sp. ALS3]|uniref:AsnC family transcriptional regulator n=1 Tax=Enterococcus alishanensis TaxID=1303817 RepID=A0ABS6TC77_9ENTE|nr:AsnC family transcriptional regulator [Enterococcus alishanensis]MBV7390514.1 AsnC family transcriptional regulator [Enterococcus alishanensis]